MNILSATIDRMAWAAGLVILITLTASLWSIERTPLPDIDETYIASASASLAHGGASIPSVLAPGPWNVELSRPYGPTFFWLSSVPIRIFGLSATSARLTCLIGALLAALGSGWLVRRAGVPVSWAVLAAAMIWLSPPIGTAATNGRMDSVAAGLELWALALIVVPDDVRWPAAVASGSASGVCLSLALLCNPRALIFGVALPLAFLATLFVRRPAPRGATIAVSAACGVCAACFLMLLHVSGTSPLHWARGIIADVQIDTSSSVGAGRSREWALGGVSLVSALAATWLLAVSAIRGWRWRRSITWTVVLVVMWTVGNAVGYVLRVNTTFLRDTYFVLPVLAAALGWSAAAAACRRVGGPLIVVSWLVVLAIFTGGRLLKLAQVADTWAQRDPSTMEAFFHHNVPTGSLIYGYDHFYFYAIERAGSSYRTFWPLAPFVPGIGRPPADVIPSLTRQMAGQYFVWPDDEQHFPLPDGLRCVQPGRIAVFVPPPVRPARLFGRIPPFARFAHLQGYPRTNLYRIPRGCPAG